MMEQAASWQREIVPRETLGPSSRQTCCRSGLRTEKSMGKAAVKSHRCWRWRGCSEAMVVVVVVMVLMLLCGCVDCYNVDTDTAVVHTGRDPDSMFGFSVAQHIDQSTNWVLVGAPKSQTSQPGIEKGGAVFRCRTDRVRSCQEIPFDTAGNNKAWNRTAFVDTEDKSEQWFGATVQSSGENGVIVACAPRYVYFSTSLNKREPVGTCYVKVASTTESTEFSPCKNAVGHLEHVADQFHKQGYCQLGYSAAFSVGGNKLLIGAVGSWYWQGQLYNYNSRDPTEYSSTNEGPADEDDSYMGYSSAVGDFDGDRIDDYAVGIPKGASHLGKVALFTQDMTVITNITGEQIGAYFGAALAVIDLNKDGEDDIIVGAPLFSDFQGSSYDTGRVYIYYQTADHQFNSNKRDVLDGKSPKSRFGMALTGLGDINYDGSNDLAVGAPWGGDDGKGAVYIYHGSSKGIITEVSQVVQAKDVDTGLFTFGSALSGGMDQDGNSYPDLIVGAYESNKAVFLKSRAVVRVHISLRIDPKDINLDLKSCSLIDRTKVTCLTVSACMQYDGVAVPEKLRFDASWELDVLQRNLTVDEQRAFFMTNPTGFKDNNTYELTYKAMTCTNAYAYVKEDLIDKLTPIAVDFKFKLHEESTSRPRRDLEPILDQYIPTSVRTESQILKDCGEDNKCIPNLSLIAFRVTGSHVIGSDTELEIMVTVENHGEDSFNTKLYVTLPKGVSFRNKVAVSGVISVACGRLENIVVCDLGNPLPKREKTIFTLRVSAQAVNESENSLVFYLQVNSTNPEKFEHTQDNEAKVEIPVTAWSDINIYGGSDPEQVILNTSLVYRTSSDIIQHVEHLYQLRNQGPSNTKEIELQILWPSHDRHGNPILEIEGKLQLNGTGRCNVLLITPENATKYGLSRLGGGSLQVVLPNEQDEFEDQQQGDGVVLACGSRRCTVIQCLVGYLEAKGNFLITVKSILNVGSFIRRHDDAQVYHIRSSASARIKSLPYDLTSVDVTQFAIARQSIITTVNTDRLKAGTKKVEIWIIALAISAGILVLLLLVLLLWWCGFFKRRKPEDEGYMVAGVKSSNVDNKVFE